MMVIYHDIGGSHSSVVAANIHINKIPIDRVPDKSEILALEGFDKLTRSEQGHMMYAGMDEFGCGVYTISREQQQRLVVPALIDMYTILNNGDTRFLYVVNTTPTVNFWMCLGGGSSRRFGLVRFGRPIVTYGTLKAYKKIANLVQEVKDNIRKDFETKFQS